MSEHAEPEHHEEKKDDHKKGEHAQPVVIIRRVKKISHGGHHGGSWKLAYADFVTAMMAFFLMMWLLGLLNKYQLQGIAEYFKKPLKEAFQHESNQRGIGPQKDKDKDKDKDKNKDKFTEKEKPQQAAQNQNKQAMSMQQLQAIKKELEKRLEQDPVARQYKNQLNFQITADGLKITIKDLDNKQMFTTGKADFDKYAHPIMQWLSQQLNTFPSRVMIVGHTDSRQYSGNGANYSNWELSADRANAARRELVKFGMTGDKIIRVVGVGDTQLLNQTDGLDPKNRRIEIIVLSDDAMKKISSQ